MAFTVTALTDYVHENEKEILRASILGAKTMGIINVKPGIKSSEELTIMDSTAPFQADSGCSYNSSGTTTFTNRALTVTGLMVSETLCPEDLEAKFLQRLVQPGSKHDQLPLEQEIIDEKVQNIQRQLEMAVWQGDTSQTYNTNLKHFNGLLNLIDADSNVNVIDGNTGAQTDITASNAFTIFQNMYNVCPAQILDKSDLMYFCGWDTFRYLQTNLVNDNNFHYTGEAGNVANGELILPGTNVKVVAINGLNANNDAALPATKQDRIILARASNLYFGTDLLSETDEFDVWYSQDDRNIKMLAAFKAGAQVAHLGEIVEYTND